MSAFYGGHHLVLSGTISVPGSLESEGDLSVLLGIQPDIYYSQLQPR